MDAPRRLMACLSDTSRYRIALVLRRGERCVTELAAEVGLSQSCTTRHLQALGRDGLVRRRREGKRVIFGIDDRAGYVSALLEWIDGRTGEAPLRTEVPAEPPIRTEDRHPSPRPPGDAATAATPPPEAPGPAAGPVPAPETGASRPEGRVKKRPLSRAAVPATPKSGRRSDTARAPDPAPPDPEAPRPPMRRGDLEDYLL